MKKAIALLLAVAVPCALSVSCGKNTNNTSEALSIPVMSENSSAVTSVQSDVSVEESACPSVAPSSDVPASSSVSSSAVSSETVFIPKTDYRLACKDYLMTFENGSCDYWFIKENNVYHAFFLEFTEEENGERHSHISHATSQDFLNWKYEGIVLYGWTDCWDNRDLATGSVVKYGDEYYMIYTSHSSTRPGLALAKSNDLYRWERVGDGPVLSGSRRYRGKFEGNTHVCNILADPYIYPELIDGYYYMFVNSWAIDMPKNSRGCQLILKSENLTDWTEAGLALLTEGLDRLETCQVWEHGGKWYMSFGGCIIDPEGGDFDGVDSRNYIYMADSISGPYEKQPWSEVKYPDTTKWYYIQKQMLDPYGDEVMLPMSPFTGVLWPYYIDYSYDGTVSFRKVTAGQANK